MFKVQFETDNAAFEDLGLTEICSILDQVKLDLVEDYGLMMINDGVSGTIRDTNGNRIGQWDFVKEV